MTGRSTPRALSSFPTRLNQHFRFALERLIQRGALAQLLLMMAAIVMVAIAGGLAAFFLTDNFGSIPESVWWAFLRLTDPGYLGDDTGTALRIISTAVTVLGYVLFMGSLIAIMTQWLNQEIRRLDTGLTPIAVTNHILILGWTSRTPSIIRELVLSEERVKRFLVRRRARGRLRIVVLDEDSGSHHRHEVRQLLGRDARRVPIFLRTGSSLRLDHLERVSYASASAIIIPGANYDLGGPDVADTRIIKTLLSISPTRSARRRNRPAPIVMAELFDADKVEIAHRAYGGTANVIAGDAFIARLIVQAIRHDGLTHVYSELLSYEDGNEIYIKPAGRLAGLTFSEVRRYFTRAIPIGVIRAYEGELECLLNPEGDMILEDDDRIASVADSFDDCEPAASPKWGTASASSVADSERVIATSDHRRILVLGWSHKVASILDELAHYGTQQFHIDILSVVSVVERDAALPASFPDQMTVTQLEGDYTKWSLLQTINWASYDNVVVIGSDWLGSSEATDARSVLGYSAVRSILEDVDDPPRLLVEVMDPSNTELFEERPGEVLVSPAILSHMLAHATLRSELTAVFESLFGPRGAELFFRPASDFDLVGTTVTFSHVQDVVGQRGAIALGIRRTNSVNGIPDAPVLNPGATSRWTLGPEHEIVVLTDYE